MDVHDHKKFKEAFRPNTKLVWFESMSNPTLNVPDMAALAKICKERGALTVVDNTLYSPVLCNPLDFGIDIAMHSISKYIGGHSDVLAGCLCFNDEKLYDKLFFNIKTMGTAAMPFDAWVAMRGAKTLALRME